MSNLEQILLERKQTHGNFSTHANISQSLKRILFVQGSWLKLKPEQQEALEMICHKIGRILNGNPNHLDHWNDIAGYATLVANSLCVDVDRNPAEGPVISSRQETFHMHNPASNTTI